MLSAAFANRLAPSSSSTAEHASVIVLSDSQLEPSLVVLRQFVHSALDASTASAKQNNNKSDQARHGRQRQRQRRPQEEDEEQNVVLISLEQAPERRILPTTSPATRERERVRIIDATLSGPYGHAAAALSSTTRHVDLSGGSGGGRHDPTTLLLTAVRDSIAEMDRSGGDGGGRREGLGERALPPPGEEKEEAGDDEQSKRPVLVVIDSVNALADEFSAAGVDGGGEGSAAAARCIKRVWETLRGRRGAFFADSRISLLGANYITLGWFDTPNQMEE